MNRVNATLAKTWTLVGSRFLPFAEGVVEELPVGRLLRLSLFQVSVGMAIVLMIGTLNRVMIVELGVPAWLVAVMISLPLVFAPFRAVVGHRSDNHRSFIGWRRVPYIWIGTMLQFGGFAIMPFALIILSGDTEGSIVVGEVGAALAFLLVGAGLHTVQTVGLALATDLTPPESHPQVVALLSVMLLVGMVASAVVFGMMLSNFSEMRLIQVIQGAAVITLFLNFIALWKQEARDPSRTGHDVERPDFVSSWRSFSAGKRSTRRLLAVGLGTAGFSMGDVLLEPYGGQILHLSVGSTTALTALLAVGGLAGFAIAGQALSWRTDPYRLAANGVLVGLVAFAAVIFAAPLESAFLFGLGTGLIGFGAGLFAVGTLVASMSMSAADNTGLALGAWGAAQATAAGSAIAIGGVVRDVVSHLAAQGSLGPALEGAATGYSVVYHIELLLLFAALVAIGPLVRSRVDQPGTPPAPLGLAGSTGR